MTFLGLPLQIQEQTRSLIFPKCTVNHSSDISGKDWNLVLLLLQTQRAGFKLAVRALNDHHI